MALILFRVQIVAKRLKLRRINAVRLVHKFKPDSSGRFTSYDDALFFAIRVLFNSACATQIMCDCFHRAVVTRPIHLKVQFGRHRWRQVARYYAI
ncbi:MAG: hypothetical protein JST16_04125 [Bdellovibrionales bacterium]|nr:hypothetical protein [Bdellovibrionales bacterium]